MNDKLSATYARWKDSILAHQITNIHHVLGHLNIVADRLSRLGKGTPKKEGDSSEWTILEG
jgi:hypothetical protein